MASVENFPAAQDSLDVDPATTVTLVTGDKITARPNGRVEIDRAPGRQHIDFDVRRRGDAVRVVPSDAEPLLAAGRLDARLFDVGYLMREGYDDVHRGSLPLIVQGRLDEVREATASRAAKIKRTFPALRMSTVALDKRADGGRWWSSLTGGRHATVSLPAGIQKIWLDGTAHVTLEDSVPQIGAPEVWDAGYTGRGVTVAVLDTGVDRSHPDLTGQVVGERVFDVSPNIGVFEVDQLDRPVPYRGLTGAVAVPKDGGSDPLTYVGRACVQTESDELLADPAGKTALVVRGTCPFAEKYDAVVDAGATGVVIYNNESGPFQGSIDGAGNTGAVWGATLSDLDGAALLNLTDGGDDPVVLAFTDLPVRGDLLGHGTHVASTIAGTGAASDGLRRGVAPGAKILSGRVCDENGACQDSWILAGMRWAARHGADIVNMSLSGASTDGKDPVARAVNRLTATYDTLFVVAAGNAGDSGVGTPGTADAALTVGAVDKSDHLAEFSSRGPRRGDWAVKPELTAPGVDIGAARASTITMGTPIDEFYTTASGTSMATPHVAGAAALLAQARPALGADALKDALASTTVDGGYLWFEQGTGRLDAARAVKQGVYANASVNFGMLHPKAKPTFQMITYTNHTRRPVTLRLKATLSDRIGQSDDGLGLSRTRLVVRPHRRANVLVTIDPRAIERAGYYGGAITATSVQRRGPQLRTAVGLGIKRVVMPLADDWVEDWSANYSFGGPGLFLELKGAALTPDGKQIILFGSKTFGDDPRLVLMAIDATTGDRAWVTSQPVPYVSASSAPGVAVAPDGSKIFVTANVYDQERSQLDILTIAYNNLAPSRPVDPRLGERLWQKRHRNVNPFADMPGSGGVNRITVTPDSRTVLIAGTRVEPTEGQDQCEPPLASCRSSMLTIAYDSATGHRDWIARHKVAAAGFDRASDVVVSPDGDLAYVSGTTEPVPDQVADITIAYPISGDSKGRPLWVTQGDPYRSVNFFRHSTLSADGTRLLVTGSVVVDDSPWDQRMETKAIDTATGDVLWTSRFGAADHGFLPGHTEPNREDKGAIATSPDDELVFVTGQHCEGGICDGAYALVTIAYDQATGEQRWVQIHESAGVPGRISWGTPRGVGVATSPDGSQLYVTGACCWNTEVVETNDQVTLAYDSASGELLATARHRFADDGRNEGRYLLVNSLDGTIYGATYVEPDGARAQDYWGLSAYTAP